MDALAPKPIQAAHLFWLIEWSLQPADDRAAADGVERAALWGEG